MKGCFQEIVVNISGGDLKLPNLIVERYVRVLWRLATENKIEKQVIDDILVLSNLIDSLDRGILKRVFVSKDLALKFIDIINGMYRLSKFTINMLKLMIENKRIYLLREVCDCYRDLVYESSGRLKFYITLSENYNKGDREEISACIRSSFSENAECVFINGNERDKKFYGITVQYGDKLLDYSAESVVHRLVNEMRG